MKSLKSIQEIDLTNVEGKLLLIAIGRLMSLYPYTNSTPEEILKELVKTGQETWKGED